MNIHSNDLSKKILKFLKGKKVITSSELAKELKISWNTADKYLLELAFDKKIERIKKVGVNLWLSK
jgi:Mn-dependent DtxR family transcriptional regulator